MSSPDKSAPTSTTESKPDSPKLQLGSTNELRIKANLNNDNFSIDALLSSRKSPSVLTTESEQSCRNLSSSSSTGNVAFFPHSSFQNNPVTNPFPHQLMPPFRPRPSFLNLSPLQRPRSTQPYQIESKFGSAFDAAFRAQQLKYFEGKSGLPPVSEEGSDSVKAKTETSETDEDEDFADMISQEGENGGGVTTSCSDLPPSDSGEIHKAQANVIVIYIYIYIYI